MKEKNICPYCKNEIKEEETEELSEIQAILKRYRAMEDRIKNLGKIK